MKGRLREGGAEGDVCLGGGRGVMIVCVDSLCGLKWLRMATGPSADLTVGYEFVFVTAGIASPAFRSE